MQTGTGQALLLNNLVAPAASARDPTDAGGQHHSLPSPGHLLPGTGSRMWFHSSSQVWKKPTAARWRSRVSSAQGPRPALLPVLDCQAVPLIHSLASSQGLAALKDPPAARAPHLGVKAPAAPALGAPHQGSARGGPRAQRGRREPEVTQQTCRATPGAQPRPAQPGHREQRRTADRQTWLPAGPAAAIYSRARRSLPQGTASRSLGACR